MEVPPARDIVPVIHALLTAFRGKHLPVVFTEFTYSSVVPILVGELHPEHRPAPPGGPRGFGLPSSSLVEDGWPRCGRRSNGPRWTSWPGAFGHVVQSREVLDTISSW
jgi:hypothetical protein